MKKITKEQEERMLLYATYAILYLNDTACFSIQQLSVHVNDKDKESKKIFGALSKRSKEYIHNITKIVDSNMDYYCDFCTCMDDICNEDYFVFSKVLQRTYKEYGIKDAHYMSMVETMRSMVEIAVEAGRKIIQDVGKFIPKAKWLERYLLTDMNRVSNNFANWAYRHIDKNINIDFNEESEVMVCFRSLSSKLIDFNSFDKAYRTAIELEKERKQQSKNI